MAQTKTEIRALLAGAGIRPLKRFGQNFLIDGNLLRKLVSAADVGDRDVVLEVGPGTGTLTEELLARAGHVVSVEIDNGLHALCESRLGACDRFTLIHGDVLECKSRVAPMVLETLQARQSALGGRLMLVANLPYDAATPLVMDLLLGDIPVSPMCFTVQAEVAERLAASAGSKAYGPISIFTQRLTRIEQIADAPPQAFWPVPKVHSTMLRLDVLDDNIMTPDQQQCLTGLVHGCFTHRRKTMKWSLRRLLDEETLERVESAGPWDLSARPEQITVDQWSGLADFVGSL